MKLEERLGTLSKLNANHKFVNKQLYRMLYSEDLYIIAFERLKTNQGAMTSGVKPDSTVDGMSMDKIHKIIEELKNESYQPKPSRRVYISKANGKKRPLGIPCWRDKLVQEGIKMILTCIYDGNDNPTFSNESFGFRPNRGCHNALRYIHRAFSGSLWIIKADVKGFFDNVDHSILIKLLEKRIDDKRFIRLIWKFLRCGYMEDGVLFKPKKGTPQGGNLSPILANIYLHEFDMYIKYLSNTMGTKMVNNKQYFQVNNKVFRYRKQLREGEKLSEEEHIMIKSKIAKQIAIRDNIPSMVMADQNKAVIRYARYADDWVIGLKCNAKIAHELFKKCHLFFQNELNLDWNMSKSSLERSTKKECEFLGVHMRFTSKRQIRKIKKMNKYGKKYLRTSIAENYLTYIVKSEDVFRRLREKGYVTENFDPRANTKLVNLDVREIAKIFKTTMNGIGNYYSFVSNPASLNNIHYRLFLSLGKTLAMKFKSSKRKMIKKYGGKVMKFEGIGRAGTIEIPSYGGYNKSTNRFLCKKIINDSIPFLKFANWRQASWLRLDECCICDAKGKIEMHHVKHIRKLGKKVKGFTLFLRTLNRKQIPVCHQCHLNIHYGKYDGIDMKQLHKKVTTKLGIKKWEDRNKTSQEIALSK